MKISEIMSDHVVSVTPDATVMHAAKLMNRQGIGAVPVIGTDGRLRGIITDRDITLRCVATQNSPESTPVREIMTRGVSGISPESDVAEAARLMSDEQIRRLPVIDDGKVIGMLSLSDMARAGVFNTEAADALAEISKPNKRMSK